jgi:hypothetical protein
VAAHGLIAATGGLLFALGPPIADPNARAADALHRLGYPSFTVGLCTRLVPREWVCLVGSRRDVTRLRWIRFHREDDGAFVLQERRVGELAP